MSEHVVVVARDLLLRARLEQAMHAAGRRVESHSDLPEMARPSLVLVDLDQEGMLDAVAGWKAGAADVRVVGFVSHVDRATREAAEALGVEVLPRGASTDAGALLSPR